MISKKLRKPRATVPPASDSRLHKKKGTESFDLTKNSSTEQTTFCEVVVGTYIIYIHYIHIDHDGTEDATGSKKMGASGCLFDDFRPCKIVSDTTIWVAIRQRLSKSI